MTYQEKYEAAMLLLDTAQLLGHIDYGEDIDKLRAAPVTETPTQIATELGASMHRERYSL